ncbi:NAD-dependent epimerase/dehydratase family protein [Paenibacillus sp. MMS18-CY102]|uniref:NAD-dependent epimerase/dehydratase family protein n=1 Tax=Paenibacillus sp. MMS18-CY102 TaxID=2682849 RepID=UPI001365F2CB|nr:NAD-dependent epimerase/dehydratase family protein [Paenibacillus sp. MMS18-CY102]MWC29715.1 NAD-dependent epimerase/dehydratase family protein [Paenibacillus sp. MMS18-CY102]
MGEQDGRKIRVIITGVTGMVGEGVLEECLHHPAVERVLILGRKPYGRQHPKLHEIIHSDFHDLAPIEAQLSGYNACFFCLGISSVGMSEADYTKVTYNLTMHVAETLARLNPDMVLAYVTGSGTDSTEQGRSMWARVKGKTENELLRLPFKAAYMFRPGYLHPTKGLRNAHRYYRYLSWLYPLAKLFFPKQMLTLRELGVAMIHAATNGYDRPILETKDINRLASGHRTRD